MGSGICRGCRERTLRCFKNVWVQLGHVTQKGRWKTRWTGNWSLKGKNTAQEEVKKKTQAENWKIETWNKSDHWRDIFTNKREDIEIT